MPRQTKRAYRTPQQLGETFMLTRGGMVTEIRGVHWPEHTLIAFPAGSDIRSGDQLTTQPTGVIYIITTVTPHMINGSDAYIEARYETEEQRAKRFLAE
jgi:hypothetical protein